MSSGRYPKLGTTNSLYRRNQFGRTRKHTVIICCACEREAMHEVRIQVSWFRSEDKLLQVCDAHKNALHSGEWALPIAVKDTAKLTTRF